MSKPEIPPLPSIHKLNGSRLGMRRVAAQIAGDLADMGIKDKETIVAHIKAAVPFLNINSARRAAEAMLDEDDEEIDS